MIVKFGKQIHKKACGLEKWTMTRSASRRNDLVRWYTKLKYIQTKIWNMYFAFDPGELYFAFDPDGVQLVSCVNC